MACGMGREDRSTHKRPYRAAETLSTAQLAQAIGVSESSVKRWVDDGALAAVRTVGGHRRIPRAEAVRFVRATRAAVVQPAALGLTGTPDTLAVPLDRLQARAAAGAPGDLRAMLDGFYLQGRSVAAIVDGPLRTTMHGLGDRWQHEPDGILVEHRATELCVQWLMQLRGLLPIAADAPVAVGGTPPGDPYVLPTLAVAAALEAKGVRAVNLGPDTPFETLLLAARRERAVLVWLSVSTEPAREAVATALPSFAADVARLRARLILGGRALEQQPFPAPPDVLVAGTVAEAAAFARGLRASAGAPPRSQRRRARRSS